MAETVELQAIELLVDPATAQKLYKNGLAEIALRRKDKKFNSFVKAKLANQQASPETAERVMQAVAKRRHKQGSVSTNVRKALDTIDLASKKIDNLGDSFSNLATKAESLLQLTSKVKALSFVNIGLSVANIAVDITGFVIIAKKMNGLSDQISQIAGSLASLRISP